jgi:hypothetical protein
VRILQTAFWAAFWVLSVSTIVPGLAHAQPGADLPNGVLPTPIGKFISVTGIVTIERKAEVIVQASLDPTGKAKVGDFVYRGDVLQTGADGQANVTFADGTTFNMSGNARMVLDEFIYDPKSTSNSSLFSLTKGTFNLVSGKVAHTGDMRVGTPVGTMGIRGTAPRVEISSSGAVTFSTLVEEKAKGSPGAPNQK